MRDWSMCIITLTKWSALLDIWMAMAVCRSVSLFVKSFAVTGSQPAHRSPAVTSSH